MTLQQFTRDQHNLPSLMCQMGACPLQKSQLQRLFDKHKGTRSCLARIAEELPGGFRRGQVSRHLRQMGLQLTKKGMARQVRTD